MLPRRDARPGARRRGRLCRTRCLALNSEDGREYSRSQGEGRADAHRLHASVSGGDALMDWKRGSFRLWLVASGIWCVGVVVIGSHSMNVAWPFTPSPIVRIPFSNTETWEYPADWGEERIRAAVEERVSAYNRQ